MTLTGMQTPTCELESAVMDFFSKEACEIHAVLLTEIYSQRIDDPKKYASYVGCVNNQTIEKLFEIR